MTQDEKLEFGKLQLCYLQSVAQGEPPSEQLRLFELILYWVEKKIALEVWRYRRVVDPIIELTRHHLRPKQKAELGTMQIELLDLLHNDDQGKVPDLERRFHEWIETQCVNEVSKYLKKDATLTVTRKFRQK